MRLELLYNPRLLCERLAIESVKRRRLATLKSTQAVGLALGHIDTLELVKLASQAGISVIYDIGANVGTWSLLAKALIPNARIEAFEPLPKHQAEFLRNCTGSTDVTLHPFAVGPNNATETFHVTDVSDASSLLRPNDASRLQFGVREARQFPLQVFRLDDYRRENRIPRPDLIKLDIQGFELEALRGAPDCLTSAKAVITEVSFIEYYEGQCSFHDIVAHLARFGLFIGAFGINTPTGKPVKQTDVLFMRGANSSASGNLIDAQKLGQNA
jgi:FkbM family methyltransferase